MTNRTQISSPNQLPLFPSPSPFLFPSPHGSKCNCCCFLKKLTVKYGGNFLSFFVCVEHRATSWVERQPRGLKRAWCFSECQVEFLGPRREMKGASVWKWWQLQLFLFPQRTPSVLQRYLMWSSFAVCQMYRGKYHYNWQQWDLFSSLITEIRRTRNRELHCWLQQAATDLSQQCSNQSAKPHYWWHIVLSPCGLLVNSKQ